jgi:hypothetical protein
MAAERLVSACGLICSDCPAYIATLANDADAIERVAEQWRQQHDPNIRAEHVWCEGCMNMAATRRCGHCPQCAIRACVVGRGLQNCAGCADYACDQLEGFLKMVPPARATLESLRA